MSQVDLESLRSEINALGEKIRTLKSADPVDKAAIGESVSKLLEAKKKFAENNNGIGVDGKEFVDTSSMSKSEKKKQKKKKEGGGGEGKKEVANAENAAKKAAKKAEAKAKKAAMKAAAAKNKSGGGGGGDPAGAKNAPAASPAEKPAASASGSAAAAPIHLSSKSKLRPFQLAFNPNVPLTSRPTVSLTVAILTNTILDLSIVSDHTRHNGPGLGLPNGGELCGDLAIARYLARRAKDKGGEMLLGKTGEEEGIVDQWVDYASSVMVLDEERKIKALASTLNHSLAHATYICHHRLTLADLALYSAFGFPCQHADTKHIQSLLPPSSSPTTRWLNMVSSSSSIQSATQLAVGISNNTEAVFDPSTTLEPLISGMNPLEGAIPGSVVTRFPPEPSGYLHIGHAKAVLLNDYYARRYQGRLIVRFDDTNPSKEKEEFQESILEDLGKLNVKPDVVTFTSDYFSTIRGYAEYMIHNGLAFMDDTPQEQMQKERMDRQDSKHRTQTPEEAFEKFQLMCSGHPDGAAWCLRAKIDMKSTNGTMRDPVLYRQNVIPHHRSGTTFKAYPTYDLACPIVDSIEGVTHALRTTEYNDRDEQYQWIQTTLNLRRVRIHAFSRMNFMYTVLSKRKLAWFVDKGHVDGWDDPRMPTVRGVVRRGIDIGALRQFMCSQGASRRIVNMEWSKFWAENKKEIDKSAKRFMAIDGVDHVSLKVTNGPKEEEFGYVTTDYLPKDQSFGKRVVRICDQVLLETVDTEGLTVGEEVVLMRWGVVKITKIEGGLEAEHLPDGNIKTAKRKLSWISSVKTNTRVILTEFDNIISKEKLEEEDNFEDFINPSTKAESEVIGDAGLKTLKEHDVIQLERRGYYRVDRPYVNEKRPLVLFMVPDGKSKAMSGLAGKLAHR